MLETVDFGLSGLSVSPLCFGTGTTGWNGRSNQGDLGLDRLGIRGVHAVVLGMMDEDQIEENLGFVSELISA